MRVLAALMTCALAACTSAVSVPDNATIYEVPSPGYDVPPTTGTASSFGSQPLTAGDVGAASSYGGASTAGVSPSVNHSGTRIGDDRLNLAEFSLEQQKIDAALAEKKLAEARSQLVVVQPSGVPSEIEGPNIALFAQQSSNAVGESVYPRSRGLRISSACRRYNSQDDAQRAFLAAGGPSSDSLGLDPDGDGFACSWDPAPYRALR